MRGSMFPPMRITYTFIIRSHYLKPRRAGSRNFSMCKMKIMEALRFAPSRAQQSSAVKCRLVVATARYSTILSLCGFYRIDGSQTQNFRNLLALTAYNSRKHNVPACADHRRQKAVGM
ncbi:unnamed protein product [Schistocephalus solidus]|uniref:Secreted protein n=1 Tax=Schistocephalus solidus TaxID=70667 RepID=A0A183SA36_SCHSO|nr:unnamed protein product [Schistocephalus solidus]